ncbi:hypothetical protein B9Z55_007250 [Caenorhabditis nigoni]|uniref:Uncharacterized protein n=1 Tax=Caenorhabditis nigoni TaxID=1611254 RepID=A0A2G5V8Q9_9PELO|nr:hypothetical protein B9Z55_007250 [Caenorhabditis nigoni]
MIGFSKPETTKSKKRNQLSWEIAFKSKKFKVSTDHKTGLTTKNDKPKTCFFPDQQNSAKIINRRSSNLESTSTVQEIENETVVEEWMMWNDDSIIEEEQKINEIQEQLSPNGNCTNELQDALNTISSVFVTNNISRNLGEKVFQIARLLNTHQSITLLDVQKTVDKWGEYDTRIYTFCIRCSSMLNESKKCLRTTCTQFKKSQSNVSSLKTVATFLIRKQIEHLIELGYFDSSLLTRSEKPAALTNRLCDTPKYKDRIKKSKEKYPGMITMFLSLNTDGFRKKGCSRGEIWPLFLAVNDITKGKGKFCEYRPEAIVLSAIMQSNTKLSFNDFLSLFQRMKLELEETSVNPMKISFDKIQYDVRLEIFQCSIDFAASQKIHGLPMWLSYDSCSRCSVSGKQIKTKKGSKICWYPEEGVKQYNETEIPKKLLKSGLPPPYQDGFDALHIIMEGTSRDLLKDLLGTCKKIGMKISKRNRLQWSDALNNAKVPRGRCSAGLLNPIQLTSRTGTEVQNLYELAIPTLLMVLSTPCDGVAMLFLHWLLTRKCLDWNLSSSTCSEINQLSKLLSFYVGTKFNAFYTMKFHYFIDHMAPTIRFHGSPLLSSAAPFERLNQTMGRSANAYTTKTLMNICKRFLAMKTANTHQNSERKADGNILENQTDGGCLFTPDVSPLTTQETIYLNSHNREERVYRTSWSNDTFTFCTRAFCLGSPVQSCFIYFYNNQKTTEFGSIERLFMNEEGNILAIIQKFNTIDPFEDLMKSILTSRSMANFSSRYYVNGFYRKIISCSYFVLDTRFLEGYATILEFSGNSFVSRC